MAQRVMLRRRIIVVTTERSGHSLEQVTRLMSTRPSTTLADRWFAAIFRIPESIFQ
jgi:hypothetical protein